MLNLTIYFLNFDFIFLFFHECKARQQSRNRKTRTEKKDQRVNLFCGPAVDLSVFYSCFSYSLICLTDKDIENNYYNVAEKCKKTKNTDFVKIWKISTFVKV